jgi:outer membrane protein
MRLYILPLTFLLCFYATAQDTTNKWSLRKCVDYAVQKNISVLQSDIQRKYAEIDLKQSEMTKLPTLNGNLYGGYSFGLTENRTTGTLSSADFFQSQASVSSNYTIFNWYARKNTIQANKLNLQATKAGIEKAQNDISLSVANTFLQAMLGNETVRIAEVQINQTYAQLSNTNALVKAGTLPELNSLQLEAQLANDSASLIQARSTYRQAIIQLKALLNLPQDTTFEIIIPPVDAIPVESLADLNPAYVYNLAVANQPLQRINALRLQQASSQAKAARGSMYPTLFASGSLSTAYARVAFPVLTTITDVPTTNYVVIGGVKQYVYLNQVTTTTGETQFTPFGRQVKNNFGQSIGVGVSFNIFNQYQSRSQWQRAKVQLQQYELQQRLDNATLQSDIYNAYELAVTALQKFHASERQVQVTEQAADFSNKRYSLGLLNVLDLITTQNNLLKARIEMVRNKYDFVFKMKVLEFYKGQGIRL